MYIHAYIFFLLKEDTQNHLGEGADKIEYKYILIYTYMYVTCQCAYVKVYMYDANNILPCRIDVYVIAVTKHTCTCKIKISCASLLIVVWQKSRLKPSQNSYLEEILKENPNSTVSELISIANTLNISKRKARPWFSRRKHKMNESGT